MNNHSETKQLLTLLVEHGAENQHDLINALNDGALLARLNINNQDLVENAHHIALNLAHGTICKQCGNPSPYGVGFAAYGIAASVASFGLVECACGHTSIAELEARINATDDKTDDRRS